jgi:hypothetical protein
MNYRITRTQGIFGIKETVENNISDPEVAIFLKREYQSMDHNGGEYEVEAIAEEDMTMYITPEGGILYMENPSDIS